MQETEINQLTQPPIVDRLALVEPIKQLFIDFPQDVELDWLYPLIKSTIMEAVLIHTYGNQSQAAAILGIHRETLRRHYRAYERWQNKKKNHR